MAYVTLVLKIEEEDIKDFLSNFYDDEELENMDIADQASETVSGVLSDHFSDFYVIDDRTLVVGDFD